MKGRLQLTILSWHGAPATGLIAFALLVRVGLIAQGWPHLNSDEAVLGLMGRHIAYHGDHPVFEYGQAYMSALEAYLAAGFFRLFGPSLFTLRLGLVVLFALFLAAIYVLTRLLYSRTVALVCLGLLALGSHDVLFRQLEAEGGIQEMLVFLTAALLLASYLLVSPLGSGEAKRWWAYLGLGMALGLSLYADPLALPYVLGCVVVVTVVLRAEIGRKVVGLLSGGVVGLSPALAYNVMSTPRWASLTELARRFHSAGSSSSHTSALDHLAGTILVALPAQTGGSGVCSVDPQTVYPISRSTAPHVLACTAVHGIWGIGVIAAWLLALLLALHGVRGQWSEDGLIHHVTARKNAGRLMLITGSGATLLLYLISAASGTQPWGTQRYLSGMWIAVPALLAPIVAPEAVGASRLAAILRNFRLPLIGMLVLALAVGTVGAYLARDEVADNRWASMVAGDLEHHKLTRIYTDYWSCYRLEFVSQERIACGVVDGDLRPGWDRNPPSSRLVVSDASSAYVLPGRQPWIGVMAAHVRRRPSYFWLDGFIVHRLTPLVAPESAGGGVRSDHRPIRPARSRRKRAARGTDRHRGTR